MATKKAEKTEDKSDKVRFEDLKEAILKLAASLRLLGHGSFDAIATEVEELLK